MADVDPFGRKKDEDPLASLGWRGDESESTTAAEAQPQAAEPAGSAAPDRERSRRTPREPAPLREGWQANRSGSGSRVTRIVRGLVLLAILAAVGGTAISALVRTGADKVDRFMRELTTPEAPAPSGSEVPSGREQPTLQPPPPPPARAAVAPRGLGRGSLLRPFAFGAALKRLRNGGYGRLTNLRVAPERIDATLLTKGGALRHVQIVPGAGVRQFGPATTGFRGVPTTSLAGIDPGAPQRLTRSAAERLGLAPSRVNYLVYTQFAGTAQWVVYFKAGQIFSADANGRITRRIS